jgi:hypothetical protein
LINSLHTALVDTPVVCLLGSRQCGKDYCGGVVLYAGNSAYALAGNQTFVAPLAWLWER